MFAKDFVSKITFISAGPSDAGVYVSGNGIVRDFITSLLKSITSPFLSRKPTTVNCLPNPFPPDLQRYAQIGKHFIINCRNLHYN